MGFNYDLPGSVMVFAGTDDYRDIAVIDQDLNMRRVRPEVESLLGKDLSIYTVHDIARAVGEKVHNNRNHYQVLGMRSR